MDVEFSGDERRRSVRLRVKITIIYQIDKPLYIRILIGNKKVEATALDLSEYGMSILTGYDIPVSSYILAEFMLYKFDNARNFTFYKSIRIKGEVRYNILLEGKNHRLGIFFIDISEEDRAEIANFVKKGLKSQSSVGPPAQTP